MTLALERRDATVLGIDVSPEALRVAAENAGALGASSNTTFLVGDLLGPVANRRGAFDLVASNPPYVSASDRDTLAPEVRDHEPPLALFPPGGALDLYRRLAAQAAPLLVPSGVLLVEVGAGMAADVERVFEGAGLTVERVARDLQGIDRVVVARRTGARGAPIT